MQETYMLGLLAIILTGAAALAVTHIVKWVAQAQE